MDDIDILFATDKFCDAMAQKGIVPPQSIEADGEIHHFSSSGRPGDKKGWYVFRNGKIPTGSFGDFRTGVEVKGWRADAGRPLTESEEKDFLEEQRKNRNAREQKKLEKQAKARQKASRIMASSRAASDDHPYLIKKQVKSHGLSRWQGVLAQIKYNSDTKEPYLEITSPHNSVNATFAVDLDASSAEQICRDWQDVLLIPMLDTKGDLQSLQFISQSGDKKFLGGGKMQGSFFPIGDMEQASTIMIAEGYATAATIHEVTGLPVAVAYNAGNLLEVAQAIKAAHPNASLVICADDDWRTKGNPGLTKGAKAAAAVGGRMMVPVFGTDRPVKATDFNDMAAHAGIEAVRQFFKEQFSQRNNDMTHIESDQQETPIFARPANSNAAPIPLHDLPDDKITTGTLIDSGTAPYQHDKKNKESFFVTIKNGDKTRTLWGIDLGKALAESGLGVNDEVAVYNRGKVRVQTLVNVFDTEGKLIRQEPRSVTKNLWHIGPLEQYLEERIEDAPAPEPQYQANPRPNNDAQAEYTVPEAAPRPAPRSYTPLVEPVARINNHFSADEFPVIQKIWKDVPYKTAYHTEDGYHLVVDEVRKVIVTKDRIELAQKPRHRTDASYAAACEHARQFWGGQMEIQGDNQHRVKAWAYAHVYGVEVTNFSPNDRERLEAEKIMAGLRKDMEPAFSCPSSRPGAGHQPAPRPGA